MLFFQRKSKINTKDPKVEFSIGETTILVRRLATARRISLRLKSTTQGVLTAPPRVSLREIKQFAESQREWIEKASARLAGVATPFVPGAIVEVAGLPVTLVHQPAARGASLKDGELIVGGEIEHFARRVTDHLF